MIRSQGTRKINRQIDSTKKKTLKNANHPLEKGERGRLQTHRSSRLNAGCQKENQFINCLGLWMGPEANKKNGGEN